MVQGNEDQFNERSVGEHEDSIISSLAHLNLDQQKCKLHPTQDVKAFCKNDLCSICFKCLLGEHRNHEVIMLDELNIEDLGDLTPQFQDKVEDQIAKLSNMREKVHGIKENYDKKVESLYTQFKEIENLFISGFFEQETLGDIKNGKNRQQGIVQRVTQIIDNLNRIRAEVNKIKQNKVEWDFYMFDSIRTQLDQIQRDLINEVRELRKLSCRIADYQELEVVDKFDELLHNTFILKKSYSSNKFVHYFEWGSKTIHFFDVDKVVSHKVTLKNAFSIPKFCRTVVTDEGRVFCIGGRHQDNMCCDWMLEYIEPRSELEYKSPLLFKRSDFTALYSERGLVFVIGGNDAKSFYTACEKYDIQNDTWSRIADLNVARDSAASCIFNNKYIYVFSGRTKFDKKEITDTIEMYDIDYNMWRMVQLNAKSTWTACDLAMCMPIDSKTVLIFGGFDRTARTSECFKFNTEKNLMEREVNLPKVGSFSNYVFCYDSFLYVVGWNNSNKNLYVYNIADHTWKIEPKFALKTGSDQQQTNQEQQQH